MRIPMEIIGASLLQYDDAVFLLCDDIKKGKLSFKGMEVQHCISIHSMRGSIELLRICARELTTSQKDFHIVNKFIDELEKINTAIEQPEGTIEVVE